jgi:anti-anti-sigma factor
MGQAEGLILVEVDETLTAIVARVSGEIDLGSAPQLEEHLAHTDGKPLLVDMSHVTFLDSSGLSALLRLRARANSLRVINPSEPVAQLLRLVDLYDHFCSSRDQLRSTESTSRARAGSFE